MKIPNRLLGIEWDHRNGGGPRVERVVTMTVPAEVAGGSPEERGHWLAGALDGAAVAPGPAVAALPRGSALWRRITLPPGLGTDRESVLEFQARRELPLPLEEVHAAWHADPDGAAATLGAVRRALVGELRALYAAAGCPLVALVPSAIAALAAARANAGPDAPEDWFLVDVGSRESEIIWAAAGAVRLVRTASVGLTAPGLVQRLGGELDRACRSIGTGRGASGEETPGVEVAAPTQIRLTATNTNGLAGDLSARVNLPVGELDGLGARPAQGDPGWVAIGAAWSMLDEAAVRLDLLEPVVGRPRPKPKAARRNTTIVLGVVAVLLILLAPGFYLDGVESDTRAMNAQAAGLEAGDVGEVRELIKRRRLLREWQADGREHWIEIATALARAVPPEKPVYIESLTFREGTAVRIRGAAVDSGAVQNFVRALGAQPELTRVTLKNREFSKTRKTKHKWDWTVEATIVPKAERE
jgi:hypothetical protein